MRLYLVRRTRSFIKDNYAYLDESNGRKFLLFENGSRSYFPERVPKTLKFPLNEKDNNDQYARLYSDRVVDIVNGLSLPRYGLGNYVAKNADEIATNEERRHLDNLSRAGKRLMGFCRTNLFKRLESSGQAFLLSIDRHVLRNYIYIYAIDNGLPIPTGIQSAELLDVNNNDEDTDVADPNQMQLDIEDENDKNNDTQLREQLVHQYSPEWYANCAKQIYEIYSTRQKKRFKWLRPILFTKNLRSALAQDATNLGNLLREFGKWDPENDTKLAKLEKLLNSDHCDKKVLIFTQFADTVRYLTSELKARKIEHLEGVSGEAEDPTSIAYSFSPVSNEKNVPPAEELRILISTDVLSEGQNLQDCAVVVNYDLPWALIRLVQRVGRVDRIGQKAENINCYSFIPAEGLEKIIRLRDRVRQRIKENGEVLGSDEQFFEDDLNQQALKDLYTEKSGILDGDFDSEVDLASYAYQIWHNATKDDPALAKIIAELPNVVYSTREHKPLDKEPEGVLIYMNTAEGNDSLAWMNRKGESVTQSQLAVLRAAECLPATAAIPRNLQHHELVKQGVQHIVRQEKATGGQLGRPSGARYRSYDRLKRYYDELKKKQPLLAARDDLVKSIDDIYRFPLRQSAVDILNRQMRSGISDEDLAELVIALRNEDRLSLHEDEVETEEPRIICSMGLFKVEG